MLRNILVLATTLTLAAVAPAIAQTSTDDAYTTMRRPLVTMTSPPMMDMSTYLEPTTGTLLILGVL